MFYNFDLTDLKRMPTPQQRTLLVRILTIRRRKLRRRTSRLTRSPPWRSSALASPPLSCSCSILRTVIATRPSCRRTCSRTREMVAAPRSTILAAATNSDDEFGSKSLLRLGSSLLRACSRVRQEVLVHEIEPIFLLGQHSPPKAPNAKP